MKQLKVAVCDLEEEYLYGLMEYLNRNASDTMRVIAFTSIEKLEEFLKDHKVDVILISDTERKIESKEQEYIILYLSKEQEDISQHTIYKYQSISQIETYITSQFQNISNDLKTQEIEIIMVYSPIGRCGKTTLAKGISAYLAKRGLYLGLEEYSGEDTTISSMDEVFYCIKTKDETFNTKLLGLVQQEQGIDKISSPFSYLDSRQIGIEDFIWLFQKLKENIYYDKIVLDIGVGVLWEYSILELADKIFMPILHDKTSERKQEHFQKVLEKVGLSQIKNQLYQVEVPKGNWNEEVIKEWINQIVL